MTQSPVITTLSKHMPWYQNAQTIALASSLMVCRNIEKFLFPSKLESHKQSALVGLLEKEFKRSKTLSFPSFHKAAQLSSQEREFLAEHFLVSSDFHQAHGSEGFVVDESGCFAASMHIEDHLRLYWITPQIGFEKGYSRLTSVECAIGEILPFAFSPRFGFLTSSVELCGCGMEAKIFLQLPALIHTEKLEEVLDEITDSSLSITGLQGDPTEVIGDVLVLKNYYNLGVSEDMLFSSVYTAAMKLIAEEEAARQKVKKEQNIEVKDRVSRAFGILMHSYQIDAVEALNALSLVKLGCDLGWVEKTDLETLNLLFFQCRRAHLLEQVKAKEILNEELFLHKRSEFIHHKLQGIVLTIE
jgi:protein arginine kinase